MFGLRIIISTLFVVAVKSDLTCDPVIGSRALDQITSITSLITRAAITVAYGVRLQVTDLTNAATAAKTFLLSLLFAERL